MHCCYLGGNQKDTGAVGSYDFASQPPFLLNLRKDEPKGKPYKTTKDGFLRRHSLVP